MRGCAAIGLFNPKSATNVGGAMRAIASLGGDVVLISGGRYKKMKTHPADTMKAWKHVPVIEVRDLLDGIPHDCVPIAVEIMKGAQTLGYFKHPERAYYIFGAEDLGLSKELRKGCKYGLQIPSDY